MDDKGAGQNGQVVVDLDVARVHQPVGRIDGQVAAGAGPLVDQRQPAQMPSTPSPPGGSNDSTRMASGRRAWPRSSRGDIVTALRVVFPAMGHLRLAVGDRLAVVQPFGRVGSRRGAWR